MLTQDDKSRVARAVEAAEARTTGEVYCVVAGQSADYREVPLAWGAAAALAVPALLLLGGVRVTAPDLFAEGWTAAQVTAAAEAAAHGALLGAILLQALLFLAVALLVALPSIRLLMTPKPLKRERVQRRAEELFLSKNLAATRERTGILIYVSVAEHMAELIADEGIAAKVDDKVWDEAMARLMAGFKAGEPARGFEDAVGLCADILAEHFPPRPKDNPNELPDHVVVLP